MFENLWWLVDCVAELMKFAKGMDETIEVWQSKDTSLNKDLLPANLQRCAQVFSKGASKFLLFFLAARKLRWPGFFPMAKKKVMVDVISDVV